jgi:hypothetical protein
VFIDKNDVTYVADSQSDAKTNPGIKRGIWVGNVKDGKFTAFIALEDPQVGSAEEVATDDQGNIFAGFTNKRMLKMYVKALALDPASADPRKKTIRGCRLADWSSPRLVPWRFRSALPGRPPGARIDMGYYVLG